MLCKNWFPSITYFLCSLLELSDTAIRVGSEIIIALAADQEAIDTSRRDNSRQQWHAGKHLLTEPQNSFLSDQKLHLGNVSANLCGFITQPSSYGKPPPSPTEESWAVTPGAATTAHMLQKTFPVSFWNVYTKLFSSATMTHFIIYSVFIKHQVCAIPRIQKYHLKHKSLKQARVDSLGNSILKLQLDVCLKES